MRLAAPLLLCLITPLAADEGTWLVNQFPAEAVKQKYNFDATAAFLGHLQAAAVRIAGGSGAFVSGDGLILTNQHLIAACLAKLSDPQHDYVKNGFNASTREAELPCTGLDASVLTASRFSSAENCEYRLSIVGGVEPSS